MLSANHLRPGARRLSAPRCGAGDEGRGLSSSWGEARAKFDPRKTKPIYPVGSKLPRDGKSRSRANRKPISGAAKAARRTCEAGWPGP
jgi:hypothetical protein